MRREGETGESAEVPVPRRFKYQCQ